MRPQPRNKQRRHIPETAILVGIILAIGIVVTVVGRPYLTTGGNGPSTGRQVEATPLAPTTIVAPPTAFGAPTETPGPDPTPPPTVILPPMTPVPTGAVLPEPTFAIQPAVPHPTPKPSDPYQLIVAGARLPDPQRITEEAAIIAIGTVQRVLPARWSTPDGKRPANPHAEDIRYDIFRPVVLEVELYLKGPQLQTKLLLFAIGGAVGQDSVTWEVDDLFEFREGERVAVYLADEGQVMGANPLWTPRDRYTVTDDNRAVNVYRAIPLQQLVEEVQNAVGK